MDEGLHSLPPAKIPDKAPETTTDGLTAWAVCAIDFNSLRASKGLLSEAARVMESEAKEQQRIWDEYRMPAEKVKPWWKF